MLYNATKGIPRDLCVLCNAALINAYTLDKKSVDEALLRMTLDEYSAKDWSSPYESQVVNG